MPLQAIEYKYLRTIEVDSIGECDQKFHNKQSLIFPLLIATEQHSPTATLYGWHGIIGMHELDKSGVEFLVFFLSQM